MLTVTEAAGARLAQMLNAGWNGVGSATEGVSMMQS